jgi:hypothetical protein
MGAIQKWMETRRPRNPKMAERHGIVSLEQHVDLQLLGGAGGPSEAEIA